MDRTTNQTICIIDDDKIHHFTLEKSIQLQGLSKNMLSFVNGKEAITYINDNIYDISILPDIIFLDINMPVVNGWQFLQQYELIKDRIEKAIKIYVVSSSVNTYEISMATSNTNVSGYFSKPIRPDDLKQVFAA